MSKIETETAPFQINVQCGISRSKINQTIKLSDLDISESEWSDMSAEEKQDAVQAYIDENFDPPYWVVETINY